MCIIGDGDFMMCVQELAVCVMYNIPVVFLVLNNSGYISIRDGQNYLMGRQIGSEFNRHSGGPPTSLLSSRRGPCKNGERGTPLFRIREFIEMAGAMDEKFGLGSKLHVEGVFWDD